MRGFYVTMKRDDGKTAWLLGPFERHEDAVASVPYARDAACEIDGFSWFYAFGTSSVTRDGATSLEELPPGVLN